MSRLVVEEEEGQVGGLVVVVRETDRDLDTPVFINRGNRDERTSEGYIYDSTSAVKSITHI